VILNDGAVAGCLASAGAAGTAAAALTVAITELLRLGIVTIADVTRRGSSGD
jgi:ribosomal protein S12 methylthiotransferase accessory factor YcaO